MDEENRILDLDREWNEAYARLDCATLDRIIADDWVCIDGTGLVITKSELLSRVSSTHISLMRLPYASLGKWQS
jgi:ketosteroid isomerase-like protein